MQAPVAPKNEVLPAIYLMDSVVKVIGGEFVALFQEGLEDLFYAAFNRMLDGRTRLVHVLDTWKTVFPAELVRAIKAKLPAPPPLAVQPAPVAAAAPKRAREPTAGGAGDGAGAHASTSGKKAHVDALPPPVEVQIQQTVQDMEVETRSLFLDISEQVRDHEVSRPADDFFLVLCFH